MRANLQRMSRLLRVAAAAAVSALVLMPAASASAHPGHGEDGTPLPTSGVPRAGIDGPSGGVFEPAGPLGLPAGSFSTSNVEFLGNIPVNADTAGARLVGSTLFVTDDRGLTTYDTSVPESPRRLGFLAVPQTVYFPEEDVDTNGKILLIGSDVSRDLKVINVSNPAAPVIVGALAGVDSHTVSCVLDCTWAYNSDGKIIDLRVPSSPVLAGNWATGLRLAPSGDLKQRGHDVTEVAPGIVVTATQPIVQLDARTTPSRPTVMRTGTLPDARYIHQTLWPRQGTDRWLLANSEGSGACDGTIAQGGLSVLDTRGAGGFTIADDFALNVGVPAQGNALPKQEAYCSHWLTVRPDWHDGGVLAESWYEHGTRFLRVAQDTGKITELGWVLPAGTSASAAYWVTNKIVYVADYQRGIDVFRFNDVAAPAPVIPEVAMPALLPIIAVLLAGAVVLRRRRRGPALG